MNSLLNYALAALSRRALSKAELSDKLRRKGADEGKIEEVINKLEKIGFLNDESLTENAITSTRRSTNWLKQKLKRRGINDELIENALLNRDPELDFLSAKALMERYRARFVDKNKAFAFLARRGYSFEVINEILSEYFD